MDNLQDTLLISTTEEVHDSQAPGLAAHLETELLDDSGFDEGTTGYEDEVVVDSEDEEVLQTNSERVCRRSSVVGWVQKGDGGGQYSEKRHSGEMIQQEGHRKTLANCPSSNDNRGQSQLLVRDLNLANLNYTRSENPGESSQAQALDFVDQFVLCNDENLSQRDNFTKSSGRKSPLISRAKGTCVLAQRLKNQTANPGTFQWDDGKQLVKESVPCKKIGASLIDNHKVKHLEREIYNKEPEDKKDFMELITVEEEYNEKSRKVLDAEKQLEGPDVMEDTPNMYDIGVNTQMAAEAIEALFYGLPSSCNENDACHDPQRTCDSPPRFETNNALRSKNSKPPKSLDSDVKCIAGKSKQVKQSAQKFYRRKPQNQSKTQKQHSKFAITEKVKMDNSLTGRRVTFENPACTDGDSRTLSRGPIVHREAEGYESRNNITESRHTTKIPNDYSNVSLVDHTAKKGVLADGLSKAKLKTGDVTVDGIITYKRKRTPRSGKSLQKKQIKREIAGISIYLELDPWKIPRRKRTCRKVEKNSSSAGNLQSTLRSVLGNEINIQYAKGLESADEKPMCSNRNRNGVLQSSKDVFPFQHSAEYKADMRQDPDRQGLANAIIHYELAVGNDKPPSTQQNLDKLDNRSGSSRGVDPITFVRDTNRRVYLGASSKKKAEQSCLRYAKNVEGIKDKNIEASDNKCHEHDRRQCTKNLPKASLLKELIKLGVSESIPSSTWKDLRKKRDTRCIRVLFSQHLDDDVLKQQKKIARRLRISITVYSKDATHFVADNFVRTRNMLETIALGKPVVTHLWLESCGQAGYLIDEKNYILRDARKEKEIGFSMPVSLSRASCQPLLKGFRLFITPRTKPVEETIASLVNLVHGQIVERSQISGGNDKKFPDDLLILSCEEDYAICKPFLDKGATVYSSELLLNGIIIQKLEFERHQLFMNHVKRSNRSRQSKKYAGSYKM